MKIAYETLGCKLSYSETSSFARVLTQAGCETVGIDEMADVYIINTCSVTEHADKKCRNMIRRMHKNNPDARIIVTGCYAQLQPDIIRGIEGVYAVVGADYKHRVTDIVLNGLHPGEIGRASCRERV